MPAKKLSTGNSRVPEERPDRADARARLSKVTPPKLLRVHPNRRLFDRLDAAAERRIVWIHGPPGAGKTTLVASYFADRAIEPLWYRLDAADADPATLFFYLGAAWRGRGVGLSLPLLTSEHRLALPLFARRFFRELFLCEKTSSIVFDDLHEVPATALLHQCLAAGFEEVPEGCRVIVASRLPPPVEMARLRINGMIDVIEPDALRMSLEEAEGLARRRDADPQQVASLLERTQGWTAGLILMLEAGSRVPLPSCAAATSDLLFDYFASEIFQRMPPSHRRLLAILALMPTTTVANAKRLTGSHEAVRLLEDLRKRNYFTSHDAAAVPNYRFHPLFHDFLLASGSTLFTGEELAGLRIHAAALLEEGGQIEAAFNLLDAAGDQTLMAGLVERHAEALIDEGRNDTLLAWLARLPRAMVLGDAWLNHWSGLAITYDRPTEAIPFFQKAFALFRATDDITGQFMAWSGEAEALRVDAFGTMARYDGLIETMRDLLLRHPAIDDARIMSGVAMGMATALSRRTGRRDEISLWQQRAREAAKHIPDRGHAILSNYMFAVTDVHDANYEAVRRALHSLPDPMSLDHLPRTQASGLTAHMVARLYRVIDGGCTAFAEEAIVRMETNGFFQWTPFLAGCAANDACRRGNAKECAEWLSRMAVAADRVSPNRGVHYHLSAAQHSILEGDPVAAKANADEAIALANHTGWLLFEAFARFVAAEACVDMRAFADAEGELERLDGVLARTATRALVAPAFLLRADLEIARGNATAADNLLREAFAIARRQGDRRMALSFPRLGRLFGRALRLGIETDYVEAMIRDVGFLSPDPHDPTWPWPVKITTFGGLRVEVAGTVLAFPRKTPKRLILLLKAILAFGGRDVPEGKLIDALWTDEDGDLAHNALRTAIHRLRKLLGDSGEIIWRDGRIGLDPTRCWVDCWALDAAFARCSVNGASENDRRQKLALDIRAGDFLAGDDDLWWAAQSRDRFNRLRARASPRAPADGH